MSLSEQYLLDCAYDSINSTDPDTGGCKGAWPEQYLNYVADNGQDQLEKFYPYMAFTFGWCSANQNEGILFLKIIRKKMKKILILMTFHIR